MKNSQSILVKGLKNKDLQRHIFLILGELFYFGLALPFHQELAIVIGAFATVPVIITGAFYGYTAGAISGLIHVAVNLVILGALAAIPFSDYMLGLSFGSLLIVGLGILTGFLKSLRDRVTRDKEALEEANTLVNEVLTNVPQGVAIISSKGLVEFCNSNFAEIFHHTVKDIKGKSFFDFLNAETREVVDEQIKVRKRGLSSVYEIPIRLPGGTKDIRICASPRQDREGRYIGAFAVFEDITEIKKIQQELKMIEERFHIFMENFPGYVSINDTDLNLVYSNKMHRKIFDSASFLGKNLRDFLPSERVEEISRNNAAALKEGMHSIRERILPSGEEEERVYRVLRFPLTQEDKQYIGIIGIDVTEQVRVEEELKESLKYRELLIREVHHRVKNNLLMVQGLLSLQKGAIPDSAAGVCNEMADKIRSISLVHEKLYRGTDLTTINMKEYLKELLDAYPFAEGSGIFLEYHCEDVLIDTDRGITLGLIVTEMMTNAIKYAVPSAENPRITVSLKQEGEEYLFQFQDNGGGFEVPSEPEEAESLGLKLIYSLSRQLGAHVEIDSGTEGTCYSLRVPLQPE